MNPKDIAKFIQEFLTEYVHNFAAALTHPTRGFTVTNETLKESEILGVDHVVTQRLDSGLLTFGGISVIVGVAFLRFADAEKNDISLNRLIYTLSMWIFAGVVTHLICRLFGGRRPFYDVLTYSFQSFAVTFVLCSFVHFLWVTTVRFFYLDVIWGIPSTKHSMQLYFELQYLLLVLYLWFGVSRLNGFGLARAVFIGILVATPFVALNVLVSTNVEPYFHQVYEHL